jgi:hypothetical protein
MLVPKESTWVVPEGDHQAEIVDSRVMRQIVGGREEEAVRIIFKITSLQHPLKEYLAKRLYSKGEVWTFINDVRKLMGEPFAERLFTLSGELIPEAVTALVGLPADIHIVHVKGKHYENPYCMVDLVMKAGELIKRFDQAA